MVPAEDQEMVFPWASVMVTMVLLNEAFTCATPEVMFFRSRFFTRVGSLAMGLLLLAGDRLGGALAGAGVGVGALPADRQSLAVPQATVTGQVHQTLDIDRCLAAKVTFHLI